MPPTSLFVEASVAMPSARRYRQGQPRGRSVTGHRLCGTGSTNHTTAPARDTRALPWGRASLPSGKTLRHRTFHAEHPTHVVGVVQVIDLQLEWAVGLDVGRRHRVDNHLEQLAHV